MGKLPSVMKHNFSQVPQANIPRSVFDRSHGFKTTFNAGYLIPFMVDEILPGDTFNVHSTLFARLATPIVPFMDNLYLDTFYFFIPNRLIWDNFQKFMGEQVDPDDLTDFYVPQLSSDVATGFAAETLGDYFGLPTGIPNLLVSALPFRAYNLVWNTHFRDENLQDSLVVDKDDGPDANTDYILKKRGKRHDYFTSALPWPQKGPGVELPLGEYAPVITTNTAVSVHGQTTGENPLWVNNTVQAIMQQSAASETSQMYWEKTGMQADLSNATAATINSLRQAFQMQKLFERDARGGTRYTEIVRSHFGVVSPDSRLQRPEFLGGNSTPVMVTPVAQTSVTATTPQGNLAGFGTVTSHDGFTKSFTEHGILLGLFMVRADLTYQSGLNRMWSRRSRWDYYWPTLAHLGEQAVLNKEIYCQGPTVHNLSGTDVDDDVFGYQERYAEYRYFPSLITGKLRSQAAGSLDVWHLAQEFSALPELSDEFIRESPPIERVSAVQNEPHFILDSYIKCRCVRPMPVYSVPGLIDHF